jgi:uncharacterized membrane protein YphA (DoxX/SURF4 family)
VLLGTVSVAAFGVCLLLGSFERATIAVFAAFALVLALWGTASPGRSREREDRRDARRRRDV